MEAVAHNGNGGNVIHATGNLSECARLHEQEVITNDSYEIKKLFEIEKDVEYVVDIGANVGAFSYYIKQFYPQAHVISCEPVPECMYWVKENTAQLENMVYVNKAIVGGSSLKEVKFNICRWAGNHHVDGKFDMEVFSKWGSVIETQVTLPATTLQEVLRETQFPRIDLLKIDTEGSEGDILEGIKLDLHRIKYIIGEWHSQKDLVLIKEILQDTHDCVFQPAPYFTDLQGLPANGNIYAKLK